MGTPDPVTTAVITAAAYKLQSKDRILSLPVAGYPGESLGTIVGNWTKRRFDNAGSVGNKARLIMLNIGEQPKTKAPLSVLQPLVEAASLEEDDDLQDIWANLLANATDPRELITVCSMFPAILGDLRHRDVKFLDALYADAREKLEDHLLFKDVEQIPYSRPELMKVYVDSGLASTNIYNPTFEQQQNPQLRKDRENHWMTRDVIRKHDVIREIFLSGGADGGGSELTSQFHITTLGAAFIEACRHPKAS